MSILDSGKKRTIMLAMDGSKHSEYALQWYAENVRHKNDEVVLAHCMEEFQVQPTDFLGANEIMIDELFEKHTAKNNAVQKHIQDLAKKYKIPHKLEKLHGHAGHALVNAADANKANMVICGSRGQGLFRRTVLGSISDYIIHHAKMPVVICKHEDEQKRLHHHLFPMGSIPPLGPR